MTRKRAYVRYSDHKQDDGFSVEYQMTEIDEFMYRNGMEQPKYHIDQAISGTKVAGREAFFELVNDVKEGFVDVIVVYKLNRIFRNAYESQKYRKLFKKYGVKLMSVTQQIDEETSAGRLMTNVLSDIDQYQSETISDHVKSSMREMGISRAVLFHSAILWRSSKTAKNPARNTSPMKRKARSFKNSLNCTRTGTPSVTCKHI